MAISVEEAFSLPWHWVRTIQMLEYVEGIFQAAGLDPEGLMLPKEFWFNKEKSDAWYKDREELRRGQ